MRQTKKVRRDEETDKRLLEWWPTNGTWWCKQTREKGKSRDAEEVVQIAYCAKLTTQGSLLKDKPSQILGQGDRCET
jgi:hypothetical protein